MAEKKRPFSGYPSIKHPKHSKFAITDIWEKPVNFFCCLTRASTLVSTITLLTQVPFQKFPFLFISIIPCYNVKTLPLWWRQLPLLITYNIKTLSIWWWQLSLLITYNIKTLWLWWRQLRLLIPYNIKHCHYGGDNFHC